MSERDALYRAVCSNPHDDTPRRLLADHLEEYGEPERAEFIRVQCELERFRTFEPSHRKEFNDLARQQLDKRMTRLERGESDSLKAARALAKGGQLYNQRKAELHDRECELFYAHGAEWCKALPGTMKYRLEDGRIGIDTTEGIAYEFVRGFPSHWYGSWEVWVGGECQNCDGRGWIRQHSAEDRSWLPDDGLDCRSCVNGRIPGACHRAWKPSWTMECDKKACRGGRVWVNQWVTTSKCSTCHGSGRVPVPMPPDAMPITDVTLTTMPGLRRGRDAMGRAIAALPVNRVEHFAEYVGRLMSDVVRELLAAEWPDLVFNTPTVRE